MLELTMQLILVLLSIHIFQNSWIQIAKNKKPDQASGFLFYIPPPPSEPVGT